MLGLDHEKRQIDSLCSNIGHLLWSGIVDEPRAATVAEQLMSDTLNSGWGVRTMSDRDRGFNPIGYHTGTVWPHDNSLLTAGLVRYGFRQYANRIASDMLTAARHFDYRLPEVFAGLPPRDDAVPGRLPDRLLAAGLGGRRAGAVSDLHAGPAAGSGRRPAAVDAVLPEACRRLELRGIEALGRRFDVSVQGGHAEVRESA